LALGGYFRDKLEFEPDNFPTELFNTMQDFGLKMVNQILFLTSENLKSNQGLWSRAQEYRDLPYWEDSTDGETRSQRMLYVPVRNVARKDELAGLFWMLYEPTASLPVWRDLVGGPGYAALAAAAFAAVLFSIYFAKSITRPVQELTQGALAIADGKLDRSVSVSTGDEIGVLANTFNQMTERLRRTLDQLRERAETIEQQNLELDRRFNELRTLQNYTENILKTVESAIFSVDLEGTIRRPNRAACDLLGLEDGQAMDDLDSDALRDRLNAALELGESTVSDEMTVVSPSGEKVPVAVSVSPLREEETILGSVAVLTDLQLIKNLEALVSRQERLAALGQLTAGVAHEVRNPLSIIKACAEILHQKFGDHPEENGLCRDILEESNRLSRVVTDFLSFARPAEPSFSTLDLNDTLDQILERMEREGVLQSRIARKFSDQPVFVEADADQVEQVLLNLVRNAEEATRGEGTITIRTGCSVEEGKVWFETQDEGSGMNDETSKRIFNPFFTSKAEGTGLGLSICHRILEAHRGSIEVVESSPSTGTLFRVTFPRTVEPVIKPFQGEIARR
jgi:PAS domain S-box-containing protein